MMLSSDLKLFDISAEGVLWGPTWKRDENGWILPEYTIGWDCVVWAEDNLYQPDGPDAGDPWRFTPEQIRLLLWIYAVDAKGRFLYNDIVIQRIKGWGKDPFCSAICSIELLGPCRLDYFDEDGQAVGKKHPSPWVQALAVSKDQNRNLMLLFPGLFGKEGTKEFGLDLGKEIIHAASNKGRIEAVTSSYRALEGTRPSLCVFNETQHWTLTNGGHDMSRVSRRNLAKSRDGSARAIHITNAPLPGEDSIAERMWYAYQQSIEGRLVDYRTLYDSLEAPADTDLQDTDSLRRGITIARGDATWLDVDRTMQEVRDPNTPPQVSRRFYLNQIVAAEDAFVVPQDWDDLAREGEVIPDGEEITAFFDGSKSDDATGLMGCRQSDGHLFVLGVWQHPSNPSKERWEPPRDEVDACVQRMFERFTVLAFYGDVWGWESYIDKWRDEHGKKVIVAATTGEGKTYHPIAWDMRTRVSQFTKEAERFVADVENKELSHDGNLVLRRHVHNARRAPNKWGVSLAKKHRESVDKIDLAVCAIGARKAWHDVQAVRASGKGPRKSPGQVRSFS